MSHLLKTFFLTSLLLLFFLQCANNSQDRLFTIQGNTMGTTYSVKMVKDEHIASEKKFAAIAQRVERVLKNVNQQMSTYIDNSEISQFNQSRSTDWFTVSSDLAIVIEHAIRISVKSKGAFDVTVGPLVNLWGFGPDARPLRIPPQNEIVQKKKSIGYQNLSVRHSPPTIRKSIPEIYCDLSAIAKGFGVDKVAEYLDSQHIVNYLVEIGGEIRAKGVSHKNVRWKIGVSTPDQHIDIQKVIAISNCSVATSGDYWNYFEENGVRYSHTIDPRTGWPIRHKLASVTVIHDSCMIADAFATAIDVLGPNDGYDLAMREELPVYIIVKNENGFVEKMTPKFKALLSTQ